MTIQPVGLDPTAEQQPPSSTSAEERRRAEAIAAVASLLVVSQATQSLTPRIATLLRPLEVSGAAVAEAVSIALKTPVPAPKAPSISARRQTELTEYTYRAAYIQAAAVRLTRASREGTLNQARVAEERHYQAHLEAVARRADAAKAVDTAAARYGKTLGWYSVLDNRTTPDCRWHHGRNFDIDRRPPAGYPGTVHVHCRCRPGRPHRTSRTAYDRRQAA